MGAALQTVLALALACGPVMTAVLWSSPERTVGTAVVLGLVPFLPYCFDGGGGGEHPSRYCRFPVGIMCPAVLGQATILIG